MKVSGVRFRVSAKEKSQRLEADGVRCKKFGQGPEIFLFHLPAFKLPGIPASNLFFLSSIF